MEKAQSLGRLHKRRLMIESGSRALREKRIDRRCVFLYPAPNRREPAIQLRNNRKYRRLTVNRDGYGRIHAGDVLVETECGVIERRRILTQTKVVHSIQRNALGIEIKQRSYVVRVPPGQLECLHVAARAPRVVHCGAGVKIETGSPLVREILVSHQSQTYCDSVVRGQAAHRNVQWLAEEKRLPAAGDFSDRSALFQGFAFAA